MPSGNDCRLLITLIADLVLIQLWGAKVIFYDYIGQIGFTSLMLSLSFLYRWLNRSEAIGATTMCTGLFMTFTAVMALLNYLFLPNTRTGLDHWLVTVDATLGYN